MPTVPGGQENVLQVLRSALQAIAETPDRDALIPWPSAEAQASVATVANQIAPSGLLMRLPDGRIVPTDPARQWLESLDNAFLVKVLHDNIRFVGELMSEIQAGGMTIEQLRQAASEKYQLGWETAFQIDRRYTWLQVTGMVELRYDHNIVLTEDGRSLLETLNVLDPEALASTPAEVKPASLPAACPRIQEMLDKLTDDTLRLRSNSALYIPKGRGIHYDSLTSLKMQIDGASPAITKNDYIALCSREFGSKDSSAPSALDTLRHTGLLQQTGFNKFSTTDLAHAWIESDEGLDLVRIIHAHIRCFGELLPLLNEAASVGSLIEVVSNTYTVKISVSPMRQRLQILRECGLVDLATATTYVATPRGRAFASTLRLETPHSSEIETSALDHSPAAESEMPALIERLRTTAKDPRQPAEFEKAIAAAFHSLGLAAEHFGAAGDTDVLVTISETPTSRIRVIVDAKATSHPSVLENAIDFTTLEEHRRKYDATHVALVAVGFEAGRIINRARSNNVTLISVDDLAEVLVHHEASPLSPVELLTLFDAKTTRKPWADSDRRNALLTATAKAIAEEAEYVDESGESFSAKDIHKSIRREIDPTPTMDDVRNILDLLASPLIGGVVHVGTNSYRPGITAGGIAARLHALANAVAESAC